QPARLNAAQSAAISSADNLRNEHLPQTLLVPSSNRRETVCDSTAHNRSWSSGLEQSLIGLIVQSNNDAKAELTDDSDFDVWVTAREFAQLQSHATRPLLASFPTLRRTAAAARAVVCEGGRLH